MHKKKQAQKKSKKKQNFGFLHVCFFFRFFLFFFCFLFAFFLLCFCFLFAFFLLFFCIFPAFFELCSVFIWFFLPGCLFAFSFCVVCFFLAFFLLSFRFFSAFLFLLAFFLHFFLLFFFACFFFAFFFALFFWLAFFFALFFAFLFGLLFCSHYFLLFFPLKSKVLVSRISPVLVIITVHIKTMNENDFFEECICTFSSENEKYLNVYSSPKHERKTQKKQGTPLLGVIILFKKKHGHWTVYHMNLYFFKRQNSTSQNTHTQREDHDDIRRKTQRRSVDSQLDPRPVTVAVPRPKSRFWKERRVERRELRQKGPGASSVFPAGG